MGRRAECEYVEEEGFAVAAPVVSQKTFFRSPSVCNHRWPWRCPAPFRVEIQIRPERSYLTLGLIVAVEILRDSQRSRKENCRVDGGDLALPCSRSGFGVEKVIEEPMNASVGLCRQKSEREQSLARSLRPCDHPSLDGYRVADQAVTSAGNAGVGGGSIGVAHQAGRDV